MHYHASCSRGVHRNGACATDVTPYDVDVPKAVTVRETTAAL